MKRQIGCNQRSYLTIAISTSYCEFIHWGQREPITHENEKHLRQWIDYKVGTNRLSDDRIIDVKE